MHLCRTVSRRAERLCVELATLEDINQDAVKYLNRLSDWFLLLAGLPTMVAWMIFYGFLVQTAKKQIELIY